MQRATNILFGWAAVCAFSFGAWIAVSALTARYLQDGRIVFPLFRPSNIVVVNDNVYIVVDEPGRRLISFTCKGLISDVIDLPSDGRMMASVTGGTVSITMLKIHEVVDVDVSNTGLMTSGASKPMPVLTHQSSVYTNSVKPSIHGDGLLVWNICFPKGMDLGLSLFGQWGRLPLRAKAAGAVASLLIFGGGTYFVFRYRVGATSVAT